MSERRPKASDIDDERFLNAVRVCRRDPGDWVNRGDVEAILSEFPDKVVLAKARQLIKRNILDGCGCGCRGDFVVIADNGGKRG